MKTITRFTLLAACATSIPFLAGCPAETQPGADASPTSTTEASPASAMEASPASAMEASSATKTAGPPAPPPGPKAPGAFDTKPFKGNGKVITLPGGLKYEEMTIGKGATAETGKTAVMHYTGTLTDGTKFDSSRDRGEPFPFQLGAGQVIKGWDQGISGMKVGGRRKLTIPYQLAYGEEGRPPTIPPKATLIFDVELMDVQ